METKILVTQLKYEFSNDDCDCYTFTSQSPILKKTAGCDWQLIPPDYFQQLKQKIKDALSASEQRAKGEALAMGEIFMDIETEEQRTLKWVLKLIEDHIITKALIKEKRGKV